MTPSQAWKKLGLAPTSDRRAVKKAYAAKLKAIDPDADPSAFLKLREALEAATANAEWRAWQEAQGQKPDDDHAVADESQAGEIAFAEDDTDWPADAFDDEDWDEQPIERPIEQDDNRARLADLLWAEETGTFQTGAISAATQQLVADPRMEGIDFSQDTEDWLSWTLYQTLPRSAPAIPIAIDHFGWADRMGQVNTPWHIEALVQQADDLSAAARLSNPTHRWHRAWATLAQPVPTQMLNLPQPRLKRQVNELLASIRTHNPALEQQLDADHVAMWDNRNANFATSGGGGGSRFGWLLFIFILVSTFGRLLDSTDTPSSAPNPVPPLAIEQTLTGEQWLFRKRKGGFNLPSCAALDAKGVFTLAQYDQCFEAEHKSVDNLEQAVAVAISQGAAQPQPAQVGTRMIYSSPLWRSEQEPRVQKWMDSHPDALDLLLRPHVKSGGLPDCSKLAAAAGMSATEAAKCRAGQYQRGLRFERKTIEPPPKEADPNAQRAALETQANPAPARPAMPAPAEIPPANEGLCKLPEFADEAFCKLPE